MKIIDKNKDYYDFYQNIYRDDTFTFDRRDSYDLSKEEFASYFDDIRHYSGGMYLWKPGNLIILQVCHSFWLLNLEEKLKDFKCIDYDLSLIDNWKDYNVKAESIKLYEATTSYNRDANTTINPKTNKGYKCYKVFNNFKLYKNGKYEVKTIPILKNIGIPSLVDPLDIYLSLEEYFSETKTNSERTDPVGATNDDKIISHGFDTKFSFRKM